MVLFYYRVLKILLIELSQRSSECTARPSPYTRICRHRTTDEQYKPQAEFDSTNANTEQPKITRILKAPSFDVAYLTTLSINKATVYVTYNEGMTVTVCVN